MPSAANQSSLTILVVEDEWLVRQAIVDYLESAACIVVEAADGESAVAILQQRDGIDAVFTDIRLGRTLNGWDVGEVAREMHRDLPVIYTSGAVIIPERPVPGSVHLAKPYRPDTVLDACRSLCAARSQQTEDEAASQNTGR